MQKKYIIYAPSYNPKSGGCIVLHKLCSELIELGYDAYIHPKKEYIFTGKKRFSITRNIRKIYCNLMPFKLNPNMHTRLFNKKMNCYDENHIVIYSEHIDGNPLNAKNVVRWLLHKPGHLTGRIHFGPRELYYKYQLGLVSEFTLTGSKTSDLILNIVHMPTDIYNEKNTTVKREGTAYLLRKGKNKEITHDLNNSILIDGKSHEEIAKIFKKVKTFISYDEYTAYSRFAVLSGCESIVIPDGDKTKEEWRPIKELRIGIKYGFDDEDFNLEEQKLRMREYLKKQQLQNKKNIELFVQESQEYFK